MRLLSDSRDFANRLFPESGRWERVSRDSPELPRGFERIYPKGPVYASTGPGFGMRTAFLVERAPASQYDLLLEMIRKGRPPLDRSLFLASDGSGFHGQQGRPWRAEPGNIHLTAYFRPRRRIPGFHVGWPALAAVACIHAIDGISGLEGRAGIKWVNDIVIDGAKTAGFLAASQIQDDVVQGALLGIGLNVRAAPRIATDRFVPAVTCLTDHCPRPDLCSEAAVLAALLRQLDRHYRRLLAGGAGDLIEAYRGRSVAIGRRVRVEGEAGGSREGIVAAIGDDLELHLEGQAGAVRSGRLILLERIPGRENDDILGRKHS